MSCELNELLNSSIEILYNHCKVRLREGLMTEVTLNVIFLNCNKVIDKESEHFVF